jgi:hypothetical protein
LKFSAQAKEEKRERKKGQAADIDVSVFHSLFLERKKKGSGCGY